MAQQRRIKRDAANLNLAQAWNLGDNISVNSFVLP